MASQHPALAVLAIDNPAAFAVVEESSEVVKPRGGELFVTIKPRTSFRMTPKPRAPVLPLKTQPLDPALEVVVALAKWTCVILPGCGFAWISDAAILERHERPLSQPPPPLRSLTWHFSDTYTQNQAVPLELLSRLARHFGHDLEHLSVPGDLLATDDQLAAVLDACPRLRHVEIHNLAPSLRSIAALQRMRRPLLTLALHFGLANELQIAIYIEELVSLLGSHAGRSLQQLRLWCGDTSVVSFFHLIDAIQTHPSLTFVQPETLDIFGGNRELRDAWKALEAAQLLRTQRLPRRARLAFLSVVAPRHATADHRRAICQLDATLLQMIFTFASTWDVLKVLVN
ncbi:hypothetical protein PINS_up019927 [Pythium insidiosum]|nr:hypothetical protein PINS_up019927 [Pythium insidiosum]